MEAFGNALKVLLEKRLVSTVFGLVFAGLIYALTPEKSSLLENIFCHNAYVWFNLNAEILEEEKKIPEKLNLDKDELLKKVIITAQDYVIEGKINEIIDYLKSKGE